MADKLSPLANPNASSAVAVLSANATDLTNFQDLGSGVCTEWLLDRRVTAIYLSDMTVATVDTWIEYMKKELREWPAGQLYCSLTDLSAPQVRMTPYARIRSAETSTMRNELTTFAAVIVASNVFGQILRPFINSFPRPSSATVKIFFTRAEGLVWLEKMLVKYGNK